MSAIGPIKFCMPFVLLLFQSAAHVARYLFLIVCDALNTFGDVHYVICNIYKISSMLLFPILFYVLLTVHLSICISVINQLDGQNFCFTISLFHASTCFEHMCSKHVEA